MDGTYSIFRSFHYWSHHSHRMFPEEKISLQSLHERVLALPNCWCIASLQFLNINHGATQLIICPTLIFRESRALCVTWCGNKIWKKRDKTERILHKCGCAGRKNKNMNYAREPKKKFIPHSRCQKRYFLFMYHDFCCDFHKFFVSFKINKIYKSIEPSFQG